MEHIYHNIFPDYFDYATLYDMMVANSCDGAKFVEVGCLHGRSSSYLGVEIVNSGKEISVDFIDPWFQYDAQRAYLDKIPDRDAYKSFLSNLSLIPGLRHRAIRLESDEAASLYADQSLDFVFLDGDHSERAVATDLVSWFPKVKRGGVLAGHDYYFEGVHAAVQSHFAQSGYPVEAMGNCWMVRV